MATKKYWIDKYYNNIQSAGEHNNAFSLEWYLDLPIKNRKIILEQGAEAIDADELAERAGTISYEILCGVGRRVPRRYLRG